jgi:hypothetical protein
MCILGKKKKVVAQYLWVMTVKMREKQYETDGAYNFYCYSSE